MLARILVFGLQFLVTKQRFINQTEQCPSDSLERIHRGIAICSSEEMYHCLQDEEHTLTEICQDHKQIPQGYYPRYSSFGDDIYYTPCQDRLYQHGPAKSFQITECISKKSKCVSEGQLNCSSGTSDTDVTCRCDYKNGYAMIGTKCCSPSSTDDCTCYKKVCRSANEELDPEYNCVNKCRDGYERKEGEFKCSKKETRTETENTVSPPSAARKVYKDEDNSIKEYDDRSTKIALYIALAFYGIHFIVVIVYAYKNASLTPYKFKLIPYMIWCSIVIGCFVVALILTHEDNILNCIISVCLVTLISLFILLVYILVTHDITPVRTVYNEEYDIRICKMLMAASAGRLGEIEELMNEHYIDMEDTDYDHRSALHLAAVGGHKDVVEFLLTNHLCLPNATDRWNRSAVKDTEWHKDATDDMSLNVIITLIKDYKPPTEQKSLRRHFREVKAMEIIRAAETGEQHTIKRLRRLGTEMNLSNSKGRTALHAAAENGMDKIVSYLLQECGVCPFVRWSDKRPIDVAPDIDDEVHKNIKDYLNKCMEDAIKPENYFEKSKPSGKDAEMVEIVRLLNAASRGDIKSMRGYRKAGYKMETMDYDQRNVLHIAVSDNQPEMVEYLLTECKLTDLVKRKDRWGVTPLAAARDAGNESVYNVFLKNCPEIVDTENEQYRTFRLINAGATGDILDLKKLYERKVDMNLRDYDGRTALHLAAAENKKEAVRFLVETAKVKVSIPDRENRRPIDETTNDEIRAMLEKAAAEEEKTDKHVTRLTKSDQTMMTVMKAAAKGELHNLSDIQFLHFPMDSCDYLKNTPLHVAAAKAKLRDVKFLLDEKRVSPFVRNSFWETPLELVQKKINYWDKKSDVLADRKSQNVRSRDFVEIQKILKKAIDNAYCADVKEDESFKKHNKNERLFLFLNKAYKGDIRAIRSYLITDHTLLGQSDYDKRTALHLAAAEGHHALVKFILQDKNCDKNKTDRWNTTPLDEAKKNGDTDMIELFTT